ncbi:NAD(P)/FAD-dependent oxidoreductase [Candidatus Aenigmatarchaeota archaeon]
MATKKYDVIIVGAGVGGMTASIYTCRKKLKTLIISVDVGGQGNLTTHIENYPGYTKETEGFPSGPKLMQVFEEQAKSFGAEFLLGKVAKVTKKKDHFSVELTNGEKYESLSIILAYGKVPRELGVKGEKKFIGRGVATCATCDAPIFRNKIVSVVGGGNSALEAAVLLTDFAKKVYLIHRRDKFRGDEIMVEKIKKNKKIELVMGSAISEVKGDKFISSIMVENRKTKEKREIEVSGVFVEIGYIIDPTPVKDLVKFNELNEVIINEKCETSCEGVMAAGDLSTVPYKQAVISAGAGAKAALSVYNYIQKLKGNPEITSDWGK